MQVDAMVGSRLIEVVYTTLYTSSIAGEQHYPCGRFERGNEGVTQQGCGVSRRGGAKLARQQR